MNGPGVFVLIRNGMLRIGYSFSVDEAIRLARVRGWSDAEIVAEIPCRDREQAARLKRRLAARFDPELGPSAIFIRASEGPQLAANINYCKRIERTMRYRREHDTSHLRRRFAQVARRAAKTVYSEKSQ